MTKEKIDLKKNFIAAVIGGILVLLYNIFVAKVSVSWPSMIFNLSVIGFAAVFLATTIYDGIAYLIRKNG